MFHWKILLELKPTQVTLSDDREVRFVLEPGMSHGHVTRMKGQGLRLPNMQRGDLVVTLQVRTDSRFRVEGFDLHTVLPIKLEDAVLGGEAEVETPGGKVPVSIPAWTDQTSLPVWKGSDFRRKMAAAAIWLSSSGSCFGKNRIQRSSTSCATCATVCLCEGYVTLSTSVHGVLRKLTGDDPASA